MLQNLPLGLEDDPNEHGIDVETDSSLDEYRSMIMQEIEWYKYQKVMVDTKDDIFTGVVEEYFQN
jgi:hypothetical protein